MNTAAPFNPASTGRAAFAGDTSLPIPTRGAPTPPDSFSSALRDAQGPRRSPGPRQQPATRTEPEPASARPTPKPADQPAPTRVEADHAQASDSDQPEEQGGDSTHKPAKAKAEDAKTSDLAALCLGLNFQAPPAVISQPRANGSSQLAAPIPEANPPASGQPATTPVAPGRPSLTPATTGDANSTNTTTASARPQVGSAGWTTTGQVNRTAAGQPSLSAMMTPVRPQPATEASSATTAAAPAPPASPVTDPASTRAAAALAAEQVQNPAAMSFGQSANVVLHEAVTVLASPLAPVPESADGAQKPMPQGAEPAPQPAETGPPVVRITHVPEAGTAPLPPAGTVAAQMSDQMKPCTKQDEFAALAVNNLPGAELRPTTSGVKGLGTDRPKANASVGVDLSRVEAGGVRVASLPDPAPAAEIPKAPPVARLFEGILHEATIVQRLQPDSLAVVLKPDSRTEIFVRLEMRDGRLEASARCDRGDFQTLNANWPELRRCLQQQGVRLNDLQQRPETMQSDSGSLAGSLNQGRQQHAQTREPAIAVAPAPRRKTPALSARPTGKSPHSKRLLESWA